MQETVWGGRNAEIRIWSVAHEVNTDWEPRKKFYPHFDKNISRKNIIKLVKDPKQVSQNSFYPFLRFDEEVYKFRGKPKKEPRPIRFAARRDAYIYAYYRHLLYQRYEKLLIKRDIADCVIAYRKIPLSTNSKIGKCNIHYAKEAFNEISRRESCIAIALDISGFFENLDHEKLKEKWVEVWG